MRIELLGPIRAYTDDGAPIEIGGRRVRLLLARLALSPGRMVRAETLIDALWAADLPRDAANALQALVSRLRRALRGAGELESRAGGYRLVVRGQNVDAHRFEELTARGRRELAADRPQAAAATFGEALGLWKGAALADLSDVPFAGEAAARLEESRVAAAEDRFDAEVRLGRHHEVLADLETAGDRHPLRERLAALRMRALHAAGRQSDALAVYEETRAALAEQLGVDPSHELRETHLAMLRGELDGPVRHAEPRLPRWLTSFVGRQDELELLLELLETSRLVTVVGPGGVGKTRLAVEALTRHPAYRSGRVWFVPLSGVDTPDRLTDAVLGALGSSGPRRPERRPGPREPVDAMAALLAGGAAVLVFDNCERLVADVAELAHRLLDRLPYLTVLATSRESLGIVGEALCRLGPLDVPATTGEAAATASVRLFLDRAARVRPGFALDESTAGSVVDVCRRLDGLPLALELAAARLRSMSIGQIASRLDDRFRLLASGNRAAPAHQRTLRAVVEWSWASLAEAERTLARRLSVFPGGAAEAAVEAVCSGDADDHDDHDRATAYVLDSLVEKSMVEAGSEPRPRYRMLETVRAYAAEQLLEAGEREAVEARFVRHFRRLAEQHEPLLHTREQVTSMAVFDAEYDNLVLALRMAVAAGDAGSAWRFLPALTWYWNMVRFDPRAESLLEEVLGFGDLLPGDVRAAFTAVRVLAGNSGHLPGGEQARSLIDDCVRTGAMERFPILVPVVLPTAFFLGLDDLAERELRRARDHKEPWARACACWVEAYVRTDRGDWQGGASARAEALRRYEQVGERQGLALALISTAQAHSVRGEHDRAIIAAERGVLLASELGSEEETWHRTWLATARMRGGDMEGAWRDVAEARRRMSGRGQRHAELELQRCVADLHRRRGDGAQADQALDRLEALAGELSVLEETTEALVAPARVATLLAAGRTAEARRRFPSAVRAAFAARDVAPAAELLARLLLAEGDPGGAATALGMSQAIRGVFDQGDPELRALVAELVERLGAPGYGQAYRRGAQLPRDRALDRLAT
ncbi:BTAD domain-containing putative transcriptional regulator [Nonomuraea diastatica]|uniref:Helix-turn-helix domain-containing protein n=1 Tax=Nonomuraea diastatica TaxID=1848329 RepID=A0A4R4X4M9_9ACTN|nr:BTAD domain-containing putative transcriptional regulator [Nonomuraea diastatica]TDD25296.1 helix-turn-helix domain-containing protein [Nonomuraea diastatica]